MLGSNRASDRVGSDLRSHSDNKEFTFRRILDQILR